MQVFQAALLPLVFTVMVGMSESHAQAQTPAESTPPPSLDEALGIKGGEKAPAPDTHTEDLERNLEGGKPRDILSSALADMKQSEKLLQAQEVGLSTRRVQESVVRKLDELIATAQRMKQKQQQQQQQQQSGSESSSSKSQQSGKKTGKDGSNGQDEPKEQGQERGGRDGKKESKEGGSQRNQQGDANSNDPPEFADSTLTDAQFQEGRAEWGRLPPRVRDAVRQGLRDPMSSAYRRLTQEYYRRLAEEPKR